MSNINYTLEEIALEKARIEKEINDILHKSWLIKDTRIHLAGISISAIQSFAPHGKPYFMEAELDLRI